MERQVDVVVIGTGVAGLAAARQCARAGASCAMIESVCYGGLVLNVNALEGSIGGCGADVAAELLSQATDAGAENVSAEVTGLRPDGDGWRVATDSGDWIARAVVVASGARFRELGVAGEHEFAGRGVSHCAECDGPLFAGQDVVVVGGGDSAAQEAIVLAGFARTVHLVHRHDAPHARPALRERLAALGNLVVHPRSEVAAILGEDAVRGVRLAPGDRGPSGEIACTGLFPYVGLVPACEFVPAAVERDATGRLVVDAASMATCRPGLFAAGAVRSGNDGTLAGAASDGDVAGRSAAAHLGAARRSD